jgi:hypothetical protein
MPPGSSDLWRCGAPDPLIGLASHSTLSRCHLTRERLRTGLHLDGGTPSESPPLTREPCHEDGDPSSGRAPGQRGDVGN